MQDNNPPRKRRSETFKSDAMPEQKIPEAYRYDVSAGKAPLRPPSSVPEPGDEYRYIRTGPVDDPAAGSSRTGPDFSRQDQTMYTGDIAAGGKVRNGHAKSSARDRDAARSAGGYSQSRSPAGGTGRHRGGKEKKIPLPRKRRIILILILSMLLAGIVILAICLFGSCSSCAVSHTVTYVKGEQETERDRINGYNMGYSRSVFRYCGEYQLPPAYVAAIIKNESSYDRFAENRSTHARGLMQFMPDTAKWVAEKLKIDDFDNSMLFEADTNIRMGCWYLHWISANYFKDDYILITCAYHAGQGNVKKWLQNRKYSPDGKTIALEDIPTQSNGTDVYAKRVIRDYDVYSKHIYNFSYEDLIRSCAARFNLSPALVAAVVKTGSLYDPDAVYCDRWQTDTYKGVRLTDSSTEEMPRYGLMQLTPEMMLRHIPEETAGTETLLDVQKNMAYGCMELSDLLVIFDGDQDTALCAYRTSEEQTRQWIDALGSGRNSLTADEIPEAYAYVREYIKEVKENYEAYKPYYQD